MSVAVSHRKRSGFTLIELLVVVMIIAILASLAVARFLTIRDKGHIAAAVYDLDLVRKMLAYYSADWNNYPPSVSSYAELQDELVDSDGRSLGQLPLPNTFDFISYGLDANNDYIVLVRAKNNGQTVLRATPETITRE